MDLGSLREYAKKVEVKNPEDLPIGDYDIDLGRGWKAVLVLRVVGDGAMLWEFCCKSRYNPDLPPIEVAFTIDLSKGHKDFTAHKVSRIPEEIWLQVIHPGLTKYLDEKYWFFKNRSLFRAFEGNTLGELYEFINELEKLGYLSRGQKGKIMKYIKEHKNEPVSEIVDTLIRAYEGKED